jgi:SM-20-related protein
MQMPHHVIRDWLGSETADRLLAYALANEQRFCPSEIGQGTVDETIRRSRVTDDLGPFADLLKQKALGEVAGLYAALGMENVPIARVELELAAHGDGAFYGAHIDTETGRGLGGTRQRRLSLVYYFHRRPRRFGGGRLRLLGLGGGPAVDIEPLHDRLLAFPSFASHEVEPVSCPGGTFADSRFSVNIWLKDIRAA